MYLGYRKAVLSGTAAAVILGAGGTAMALTASDTPNGKPPSNGSSSAPAPGTDKGKTKDGKKGTHRKHRKHRKGMLKRLEHGTLTVKGKDGAPVTRTLFRGSVTAVSSTSLTVKAADGKSQTYTVSSRTTVAERSAPMKRSGDKTKGQRSRPAKSSISKIAKGDQVFVSGTGTRTVAAERIVEFAK